MFAAMMLTVTALLAQQIYLVPSTATDPCKRFDGRVFLIEAGANPSAIRQRSDENDMLLKEWEYDDTIQIVSFVAPPRVMVTHPKTRGPIRLPGSEENSGQFTLTCISPPFPGEDAPIILDHQLTLEEGIRILGGEWTQSSSTTLKREKGNTVVFVVPDDTFITVPSHARAYLPGDVVQAEQFFVFSTS